MDLVSHSAKFWPRFQLRYLLLLPVAAGIVHLIATFMAMADIRGSAYSRLSPALPLNVMQVLQPIGADHQPLPFLSADARYAMCRFSASQGPVDVTALLPDRGWTLGVYNPDGTTAYFAAGSANRATMVSVTLVAGDDRFVGLSPQALGKAADTAPKLSVAAREGLIVVRAPDRGQAFREQDQMVLAKSVCTGRTL